MNHKRLVTLADTIAAVRPDWQHAGIVSQLHILDANWTNTDAALAAHATAVAANPRALTPGAFNATPPQGTPQHVPDDPLEREPNCYTCGRKKSKCEEMQDYEITHGLPDPHIFETEDDATRNAVPLTADRKASLMALMRTTLKNVNDLPGMKHAVESAKLVEERAQQMLVKDGLP